MSSIQRIKGRIGPQTLTKAHELFRQDLATILSETLQNSRRAGASKVTVASSGTTTRFLTIRDDGCGISDMQKLVTFGDSGWNERLTAAENAAGMGTFALASRGATYRSNGKRVTLSTAVFLGSEEAVVHDDPEPFTGLEVTFALERDEHQTLERHLMREATYYPIPVTHDGKRLPQSDFLSSCTHVEAWQGVLIGLVPSGDFKPMFSNDGHHESPNINFHGHVLRAEELREIPNNEMQRAWTVLVDIKETPDLKLVLPTRDNVIKNTFWQRLLDAAGRAKLHAIAKQPNNTLPMATYRRARDLGIAMPLPALILHGVRTLGHWTSATYDETADASTNSLPRDVIALYDDTADETTKNTVLDSTPADGDVYRIMAANAGYEGHPAYDALPRLAKPRLEIVTQDGVAATLDLEADWDDRRDYQQILGFRDGGLVVERMQLVMDLIDGNGVGALRRGLECAFLGPNENDPSQAEFVATKGSSPHALARRLEELYYDDQAQTADSFYDEALRRFSEYLKTTEDAAVCLLENFLRTNRHELTGKGIKTILLRIKPGDPFGEDVSATVTTLSGTKHRFVA